MKGYGNAAPDRTHVESWVSEGNRMKAIQLTLCVAALVSGLAVAQNSPPPGDAPPPPDAGSARGGRQNFDAVKQRRLTELQEIQRCVQDATNMDQLRACRPRRPENNQDRPPPQ